MFIERTTLFVCAAILVLAWPARAEFVYVRGTTPATADLIQRGIDESDTFRALVERLRQSDLIVYVQEAPLLPSHLAGQLTFLSKAGRHRYVRVSLPRELSGWRQIASLGHELHHAIEIAERPQIVDQESLTQEYEKFGRVQRLVFGVTAIETRAALETGQQIWRELAGPGEASDPANAE